MKVYMTNYLFKPAWRFNLFGASVSALLLVMIGVAALMVWGLDATVQRTRLGRAIRAVAEDREMAAVGAQCACDVFVIVPLGRIVMFVHGHCSVMGRDALLPWLVTRHGGYGRPRTESDRTNQRSPSETEMLQEESRLAE